MSIFVIGDLHLSQCPDTDKPMDVFGSRWFNHEERIRENWCRKVGPDDTVIIPGDISWGLKLEEAVYDLDWIEQLPGKKLLLKGNHDLWWTGITKLNKMYDSLHFLQYDSYVVEGICVCGTRGWITPDDDDFTEADEKVYKRELLRLEASLQDARAKAAEASKTSPVADAADTEIPLVCFLHFPPVSHANHYSGFMQLFEDYGVKEVYYGHIHGEDGFRTTIQGNHYGVEYKLISADYLNCDPLQIR